MVRHLCDPRGQRRVDGGEEDEDGVKRGGMKGGNKAPARMLPASVKPGAGGAGAGAGMTSFGGLAPEVCLLGCLKFLFSNSLITA